MCAGVYMSVVYAYAGTSVLVCVCACVVDGVLVFVWARRGEQNRPRWNGAFVDGPDSQRDTHQPYHRQYVSLSLCACGYYVWCNVRNGGVLERKGG